MQQFIPLIREWQTIIVDIKGLLRDYQHQILAAVGSKPIKIITGFRRSGKSFLVQMVASALLAAKHLPLSNLLYLNFEDYRLAPIQHIQHLDELLQFFLQTLAVPGKKLLILDEIQNIPQWDKLIRTWYEKHQDVEIFLTGSNSELSSAEISSRLAGRFVEWQILPFSFKEFLAYQQIIVNNATDFYHHYSDIQRLFIQYQQFGGLPEILTITDDHTKGSYLTGIISKVILDDIIQRFNVRQPQWIEKIVYWLHESVGNIVTPTRIAGLIKNAGGAIKPDTVSLYIDYIVKTFAMYVVDKFDWQLKRVFNTAKKYYSIDTGIINLYKNIGNNYSKQLENIVFLKLVRENKWLYYGVELNNKEIDFITQDSSGLFYKYQVTQTLTADNTQREVSAFISADHHLNKMHNILLTMDEQETMLDVKGCQIAKKYLLKWLLDVI